MGGYIYDDGGRAAAGFKGTTGDCVTRAIAIATGKPYKEVYDALNELAKRERTGKRKRKISSSRTGVYRSTYGKYLQTLGWVHLNAAELPSGTILVKVTHHLTTMIDGVIHDIYDPRRIAPNDATEGEPSERCVYGYYHKKEVKS